MLTIAIIFTHICLIIFLTIFIIFVIKIISISYLLYKDKMVDNQKAEILTVIAIWLYRIEDNNNQLIYDKGVAQKYRGIIKKEYNKLLKNRFLLNSTNHDLMLSIVFAYINTAGIVYFASIVSDDYDKLDEWYLHDGQNKVMSRIEYRKEKKILFDKFCVEKDKIVDYLK